jgi:hypothetical protein
MDPPATGDLYREDRPPTAQEDTNRPGLTSTAEEDSSGIRCRVPMQCMQLFQRRAASWVGQGRSCELLGWSISL